MPEKEILQDLEQLKAAQRNKTLQVARAKADLAIRGLFQCMGKCKQIKPLREGMVVTWGGNVLLAICPGCMIAQPVILSRTDTGLKISLGKAEDAGAGIDLCTPAEMNEYIATGALPQVHKIDFESEE